MKKLFLFISLVGITFILHAQQVTFNYTGDVQIYVVPACVDSIMVDVTGAEGGSGPIGCGTLTFQLGGMGGRVQATIPVTTGDTLYVYVGGKGEDDDSTSADGGYNGGGDAAEDIQYSYYGGGGGGGGSDIRLNNTTLLDRIVVAGGGGGAGADGCNCNDLFGGAGGDLIGGAGQQGTLCTICDPSGQGGTQSNGGAKGDWSCNCNAQDGSLGQGGMSNTTSCGGPTGGGGGGGGYYGGGGGGLGAGGGGSSYTMPGANNIIHTQGYQAGDGVVIITPIGGLSLSVTVLPNDSVCVGSQVTLSGNGADTYSWNGGIQNGVPFTANAGATYTMTGTSISQGCSDSVQFTLFVYPIVASLVLAPPDTLCQHDSPVTLSGGLPAGGSYSGTGVSSGEFDPLNAVIDSWNVITYTVTDSNDCINNVQDSIYVDACVGIENANANDLGLKLYPNPGQGIYTIEVAMPVEIIISNLLGDVVLIQHLNAGSNRLDIANQPSGTYTIEIVGSNQQLMKLIKE